MKKIVYHGSPNEFAQFDIERSRGMIWLTGNKEYAAQFGKVKKYEITLNSPLDVREYTEEMDLNCWQEILVSLGIDTSNIDWETVDFAPEYGLYWWYDLLPHAGNNYADGGVLEAIKSAGYDGIIAPPEHQGEIESEETYVVFSAEQIENINEEEGQ